MIEVKEASVLIKSKSVEINGRWQRACEYSIKTNNY